MNLSNNSEKPTILLLHGLFVDKSIWEPLLPFLTDYTPLRFDYEGTLPSSDKNMPSSTIEALAQEAALFVKQHAVKKMIVCGHSMGGAIAQILPGLIPDVEIQQMILIGSFRQLPPRARIFSDSILQWIDSPFPLQALLPMQLGLLFGEQSLSNEAIVLGFAQKIANQDETLTKKVLKAQLNALLHFDGTQLAHTNQYPIHLIAGQEDTLSTTNYNQDLQEKLSAQSLHFIEGAGHMMPLEQPKQLGDAIHAIIHSESIPQKD